MYIYTSAFILFYFFALYIYIYTSKKFGQAIKKSSSTVNALVIPYFHYCSPAWSNDAPFRLNKINRK